MVRIDLLQQQRPITIPLAALISNDDAAVVRGIENNRTVRRPVKILRLVGAEAEIESDLKPNEKIVAAGARSLTEGQTVRMEMMFAP